MAFLPKVLCDVRRVEIARAVRLLSDSLEPVFFTVPRAKVPRTALLQHGTELLLSPPQPEFFQDDIFCDTLVTWEPALSASGWLGGGNAVQASVSLRPQGMTPCKELCVCMTLCVE